MLLGIYSFGGLQNKNRNFEINQHRLWILEQKYLRPAMLRILAPLNHIPMMIT